MSIRAQSTAAVSRQNSSQDENSGETQSISSQNLLIISSSLNRQFIRSIFEDTKDIMSIISVLVKAKKIVSLNESADWPEWNRRLKNYLSMIDL
jgi:hypothetical protein